MADADFQRILHIKKYCSELPIALKRYGHNYNIFIADDDYFDSVSMKIMQLVNCRWPIG